MFTSISTFKNPTQITIYNLGKNKKKLHLHLYLYLYYGGNGMCFTV